MYHVHYNEDEQVVYIDCSNDASGGRQLIEKCADNMFDKSEGLLALVRPWIGWTVYPVGHIYSEGDDLLVFYRKGPSVITGHPETMRLMTRREAILTYLGIGLDDIEPRRHTGRTTDYSKAINKVYEAVGQ